MARGAKRELHGVLVVDKPVGPTSHDVVARVRRALGEKRVGHAGTLDPMASGVLVVLVGEATKLAPYLTADDKRYRTRMVMGVATDSFDAEGQVVARAPLPPALAAEVEAMAADASAICPFLAAALSEERARTSQLPPAFSAVRVDGVRSYVHARAGDDVVLAPRAVAVKGLEIVGGGGGDAPWIELELLVTKGYYVRALARDLGERLGVPAHLGALRRTASGGFDLDAAVPFEELSPERLEPAATAAARALGSARLSDAGAARVRLGQRPPLSAFETAPAQGVSAWIDAAGELVAIGQLDDDRCSILRGFAPTR